MPYLAERDENHTAWHLVAYSLESGVTCSVPGLSPTLLLHPYTHGSPILAALIIYTTQFHSTLHQDAFR